MTINLSYYTPPAPNDYGTLRTQLTFSHGIRRQCRSINIVDDNFYEGTETFTVSVSTSDPSITVDPNFGVAYIFDDEGKKRDQGEQSI